MLKKMSKRGRVIFFSIHLVSLVLIGLIIYRLIYVGEEIRKDLSYSYTRSVGEITEYMSDIQEALEKEQYVNTITGQFAIVSQIREAASAAKIAVGNLPFSEDNSEKLEESLNIMSDFAYYIEKKISAGEEISEEDKEIFTTLQSYAQTIENEFVDIEEKLDDGDISIGKTEAILSQCLNLPSLPSFDVNMGTVSQELSVMPSVEYDGVFSQHIEKEEAEYLKDKEEITQEEALEIASEFLNEEIDSLTVKYESEGTLAAYQISSSDSTINITKTGGEISYFKKTLDIDDTTMTYEEALEKAKEYLIQSGYENMKETYYSISDNVCTINFVSTEDSVLLYPDLVTVTVELNEGNMMELTSTGYIMNHVDREELYPEITEEEASESISNNLEIINCTLAIIPTAGQKEILTYEFTTVDKETSQEVLIYINSKTGYEEQIYIIQEDENGKNIT